MSTMQPPPNSAAVEPDPVVGKAIESIMQNLAIVYKSSVQVPGKVPPEAIGQLMAAMAEVETQWNAAPAPEGEMPPGAEMPMEPGAEMPMEPGMEAPMDPAMMEGAMPPEDPGFMQVDNPEQQAGSFDEAAAALHDATKRDARKRGVQ